MTVNQPSNTYKFFFDNIIGELLSQICAQESDYCIRDRKIPYLLEEKYEEYRQCANNNMSNPRLDRHKLASCICGAIVEIQPVSCLPGKKISGRVNEILALHTGLNVIKYYMMYDLLHNIDISEHNKNQIKNYLREHFIMQLPSREENICDTQEYEINILNALYWSHHKCNVLKKECYHYDIWAYAKLFYHLELYNKPTLESMYKNYIQSNALISNID